LPKQKWQLRDPLADHVLGILRGQRQERTPQNDKGLSVWAEG